jgi:hypothetical protein
MALGCFPFLSLNRSEANGAFIAGGIDRAYELALTRGSKLVRRERSGGRERKLWCSEISERARHRAVYSTTGSAIGTRNTPTFFFEMKLLDLWDRSDSLKSRMAINSLFGMTECGRGATTVTCTPIGAVTSKGAYTTSVQRN